MWQHAGVRGLSDGWALIEPGFLEEDIPDGVAFTRPVETDGPLFNTGVEIAVVAPAREADGWEVFFEAIDLNRESLDDMNEFIGAAGAVSFAEFAEIGRGTRTYGDDTPWEQSLGEGLLRWRACEARDRGEWVLCRSGSSAARMMNAVMHTGVPEGFLEEICENRAQDARAAGTRRPRL